MGRRTLELRLLPALLALAAAAGGAAVLTIGGSAASPAQERLARARGFDAAGALLTPAPAPPLRLKDSRGRLVDIASYRGRAVLVTFLYTRCPDICPLIASSLAAAVGKLGARAAARVALIAVSVDPRGDTPGAVAAFLARHGLSGRLEYLIGSPAELARVWRAWGVGSEQTSRSPELVDHSGLVYGIDASGREQTIYAANFRPADIAHDVPLLAAR